MKITRRQIRSLLCEAAFATGDIDRVHRTMGGETVPFGCEECVEDLSARIEDATFHRNNCSMRSAGRTHLNGLLNIYRLDLRAAIKEFDRSNQEVLELV